MTKTIYPIGWMPCPSSIPMWQGRQIMIEDGILDKVLEALNAIPDPIERRKSIDKMEYSSNILRNDPLLKLVAVKLKLTEEQIDSMFTRASLLV